MMCAFVVTNYKKQFFSVAVHMSFYHERLESKMRNLIIVKYDIIGQNCYLRSLLKATAVCM